MRIGAIAVLSLCVVFGCGQVPQTTGTDQSRRMGLMIRDGWQEADPLLLLLFGRHADPKDHSASLLIEESSECSAVAVGPKTLLTANHCLLGSDKVFFDDGGSGGVAVCEGPSGGATTGDWALCAVTSGGLPVSKFESLASQGESVAFGQVLILTGFGYTGPRSVVGTFSIGVAVVRGDVDDNHIFATGSQVLDGDSGSPAYVLSPDQSRRFVIGVNSKKLSGRDSSIAVLTSDAARTFIAEWIGSHPGHLICGYNTFDSTCG